MDEFTTFLKNFPILTDEEIQLIVENTNIREFSKGSFLLREGEVSTNCHLVLKGCIRDFFIIDGEEKTTAFYTEGDSVNSFTSSANKIPSKHNLVCVEDCILTVDNGAIEEQMCRLIPRLESIIRVEVEKSTGKAQDELARFITSSPEERYLYLMETRPGLLNRVPQHQIASYLGITPESLSRIRKRISKNPASAGIKNSNEF
ncbi:MAG: Crp/Fnr family transcriptional regulator [Bacteroidia bacterium]